MTKKTASPNFEDFPMSPSGSVDAKEFYFSYLQAKELASKIPRNVLGDNRSLALWNLAHEVHEKKTAGITLFRAKTDAEVALIMIWLSRVREAAQLFVASNELPQFKGLSSDDMANMSKLSTNTANLKRLADLLLQKGIVLIFERALPRMKLDGAVFTLNESLPVIALSLRYSRLDIFWFTLMHELAHLVLHYDQLTVPILEDLDEFYDDETERLADKLAANALISRSDWRSCSAMYSQTEKNVYEFASRVGVHPAIVAGRVQRELGRHDIFAPIVNQVNVREELFGYD